MRKWEKLKLDEQGRKKTGENGERRLAISGFFGGGMWRRCGEALTRCGLPQRSTATTLPSADQSSSSLQQLNQTHAFSRPNHQTLNAPSFWPGFVFTLNNDPSPSRLFHRVIILPLRQHEPHARSRVHLAGPAPDLCRSSSIPQTIICAATIHL